MVRAGELFFGLTALTCWPQGSKVLEEILYGIVGIHQNYSTDLVEVSDTFKIEAFISKSKQDTLIDRSTENY